MYRPPQNSNRVKLIRKKFENVDDKSPERKCFNPGDRSYVNNSKKDFMEEEVSENSKSLLQRQFSDPTRRNIKRTPAFRVDRSVERTNVIQRNGSPEPSTLYETKIKQFSAVKNNCDTKINFLNKEKSENTRYVPLLYKSKTALDFNYVKSKFDKDLTNNNIIDSTNKPDFSLLYTEPIPKALRRNNSNATDSGSPVSSYKTESSVPNSPLVSSKILSNNSSSASSDKCESSASNSPTSREKLDSIYNKSTLKIDDKIGRSRRESLTDTLKLALSKPLPKGPAPKKPPRVFQISQKDNSVNKSIPDSKVSINKKNKSDPKYMLTKLEDALRNNKLKTRRAKQEKCLNSGEDSDDSLLTRTKSTRTLPSLPVEANDSDYNSFAFNFNCLNNFKCPSTNYEKIKEPNSCFFVGSPFEEPVYAEPFHFQKESVDTAVARRESSRSKQSARNSLYYMSTPLLTNGGKLIKNMSESPDKQILRQLSLSYDSLVAKLKK